MFSLNFGQLFKVFVNMILVSFYGHWGVSPFLKENRFVLDQFICLVKKNCSTIPLLCKRDETYGFYLIRVKSMYNQRSQNKFLKLYF
jgi:hypothetical protein